MFFLMVLILALVIYILLQWNAYRLRRILGATSDINIFFFSITDSQCIIHNDIEMFLSLLNIITYLKYTFISIYLIIFPCHSTSMLKLYFCIMFATSIEVLEQNMSCQF